MLSTARIGKLHVGAFDNYIDSTGTESHHIVLQYNDSEIFNASRAFISQEEL